MKGLILCAGKGLRLRPLTLNRPKPAISIANKPMVCYSIEKLLKANIREIGIVVGPESEEIKKVVSASFPHLHPVFITQQRPAGIAAAVMEAKEFISGDSFILLLGDTIFDEDLSTLINQYQSNSTDAVIMITYVDQPERFGVVVFNGEGIVKLIEKPKTLVSNWAITGAYIFGPAIFSAIANIVPSKRGELEITDAIQWLLTSDKIVVPVKTNKWWLDTGSPESLLKANNYLLEMSGQAVSIGKGCTVNNCQLVPPVIIGERCTLSNSKLGPYVTIGNDSTLNNVKINNCLLMNNIVLKNIKPNICNSIISSYVEISNVDASTNLQVLIGDFSNISG